MADPRRRRFPTTAAKDGGPGITASIIEFTKLGTKKKPITKKQILAKLVERFPGRREEGMQITLNAQLPNRLVHDKKMPIVTVETDNGKAYYVEKAVKPADEDFE